jgi:sortase (surface protein transpeptidase)
MMTRKDPVQIITSFSLVFFVAGVVMIGISFLTEQVVFGGTTSQATSGVPMKTGPALPEPTPEPAAALANTDEADEEENVSEVGPIMPSTLRVPRLDIDTNIQHVGYTEDGRMDEPDEWDEVAWFQYGFFPGAPGNAVIAGHLDSDTGPAIFAGLYLMELGDEVHVTGEDGEELTFRVIDIERVAAEDAPLDRIFGPSDTPQLNLITCEGHFDPEEEDYDHRLIVYTELVDG